MRDLAKNIRLPSIDDLFSTEEERQDAKLEKIQILPLAVVVFQKFQDGTFHLFGGTALREIAFDLGYGNRELRFARLYAGGTGRHDPVNLVFRQNTFLAGSFQLLRLG